MSDVVIHPAEPIGAVAVPFYVNCPQCNHPAVLPQSMNGRRYRCRQCGGVFPVAREHEAPVHHERMPEVESPSSGKKLETV